MPTISLKNRGNGPRAVIDVKGQSHVLPIDGTEDDIEVDDITHEALTDGSEQGGDLEVTGGEAPARRGKRGGKEEHQQPQERAKLQPRE